MAPDKKIPLDDLTSTYCLTSLNTNTVVVLSLLDGLNYLIWRESFLLAISIQNKQGFLDGSIKTPEEVDDPLHVHKRIKHVEIDCHFV